RGRVTGASARACPVGVAEAICDRQASTVRTLVRKNVYRVLVIEYFPVDLPAPGNDRVAVGIERRICELHTLPLADAHGLMIEPGHGGRVHVVKICPGGKAIDPTADHAVSQREILPH